MEYYTYGNTDLVYTMFNAIAVMTGANSSYGGLAQLTSILALIVIVGMSFFKGTLMPLAQWFFGLAIAWYGFFLPKVDLILVDQTNPTANRVVGNMPVGLALVGSFSSSVGSWFNTATEQAFTPNSDVAYSKTGMVFGANAYLTTRKLSLLKFNPVLQDDWSNYIHSCVENDVALYKKYTMQELFSSNSLLATMANTNQVIPVIISGQVLFCDQAYTNLLGRTNLLVKSTAYMNNVAMALNPNITTNTTVAAAAKTKVLSALATSYDQMFAGASKTAQEIIEQETMINAFTVATMQNAQFTGSPEQAMAGLAAAQAEAASSTAWASSLVMASKYLPIAHNLIECICIALFPLVLIMMILGGLSMFSVVMGYVSVFLWVKLWPGFFAIVNGIANSINTYGVNGVADGAAQSTIANASDVLNIAHQTQLMAGAMAMSVPVIAWFVVSMMKSGLSSLASSMLPGAVTTSQGNSVGMGNVNHGVTNTNSHSGNKTDMSHGYVSGNKFSTATGDGVLSGTLARGGSLGSNGEIKGGAAPGSMVFASTTKSDAGLTAGYTAANSHKNTQMAQQSQREAQTLSAQSAQSRVASNSNAVSWAVTEGSSSGVDQSWKKGISASDQTALSEVQKASESIAEKHGKKNDAQTVSAIASSLAGKLGIDKKTEGRSASASTGGSSTQEGKSVDTYSAEISKSASALKDKGISFSQNFSSDLANSRAFNESAQAGNSFAQTSLAQLQDSKSAQIASTRAFEKADAYSKASENSTTEGMQIGVSSTNQATQDVISGLRNSDGTAMTPQQILATMAQNPAAHANEFARAASESTAPNMSGTIFDSSKNGVAIQPIRGAEGRVQAAYQNANRRVDADFASDASQVQGQAAAGGSGGAIRSGINSQGNEIRSEVQGGIGFQKGQINSGSEDVTGANQALDGRVKANYDDVSFAQKAIQWGNDSKVMSDTHTDFSNVPGGAGANGSGGWMPDPKETASTVHAGELEKPTSTPRKASPRWTARKN